MNTEFTPFIKATKTLKEKIEEISKKVSLLGDTTLSNKIGAVSGLYSAYELTPSTALMEKISFSLGEIIEELIDKKATPAIKLTYEEDLDIYERFKKFLEDYGKKPDTVNIYARALKRILKNRNQNTSPELSNKIRNLEEIITSPRFDINDEKKLREIIELIKEIIAIKETDEREIEKTKRDHGTGVSALKQFLNFIMILAKHARMNND